MKKIRNAAILLLLSAGFAYAQNITVQGEKKLNKDFRKYRTFGWLQTDKASNTLIAYSYEEYAEPTARERRRDKHGDVVVYSYLYTLPSEDSTLNAVLVHSVNEEMEGRGYRKDDVSPDLLVSYKIFDHSTHIKGYNDGPIKVDLRDTHQPQDTVSYRLKPGTIFISLIDSKTGSMVWEGYASGVAQNNDIINDKLKVKEAINLIFKKYEFRGDKYSRNN